MTVGSCALLALVVCAAWAPASRAERLVFTDQGEYVAALAARGYTLVQESFESDGAWGAVRSPQTAINVESQDLTWTSNNANSEITTGEGAARTGSWGFYSLPHGDYANGVNDGFVVSSSAPMTAVGGWIRTNTPYAAVIFIVDGDTAAPVDFEGVVLGTTPQFLGVIDTDGISTLEVLETEGAIDDQKYIFGDDFSFAIELPPAGSPATVAAIVPVVGGVEGDPSALAASDDAYVALSSAPLASIVGHNLTLVLATSATAAPSRLDLTVEAHSDAIVAYGAVLAYNFATLKWDSLGPLPSTLTVDLRKAFPGVSLPGDYVRDSDGSMLLAVYTVGVGYPPTWTYALGVDQVRIETTP